MRIYLLESKNIYFSYFFYCSILYCTFLDMVISKSRLFVFSPKSPKDCQDCKLMHNCINKDVLTSSVGLTFYFKLLIF